jgi:hypothetical protein
MVLALTAAPVRDKHSIPATPAGVKTSPGARHCGSLSGTAGSAIIPLTPRGQSVGIVWSPLRKRAYYRARSGIVAAEAGRLEEAEWHFKQALDLDHECSDARLWLGHVHERRHDPAAALAQYKLGLVFEPGNAQLAQAAQNAGASTAWSSTKAAQQLKAAHSRRIVNLIFALLVPCAGFFMGVWEMIAAETPEWRDLGLRTLLCSLLGMFLQFMLLMFFALLADTA